MVYGVLFVGPVAFVLYRFSPAVLESRYVQIWKGYDAESIPAQSGQYGCNHGQLRKVRFFSGTCIPALNGKLQSIGGAVWRGFCVGSIESESISLTVGCLDASDAIRVG